jgi:predicted GNAT superfamily acetyltransferase
VSIEELTELEDLQEVIDLFQQVWEGSTEPPLNMGVVRALSHSGNYIAGYRSEGRLIAGIVGWLGMHGAGELHLHSHILGVLPGAGSHGLGFALKQHQREWCLGRSVATVEWTFDPLVGRNAYFNLYKLGADPAEYLVDFYGVMRDGINTGDESDRILVRWTLESPKAVAAAQGRPAPVDLEGVNPLLRIGKDRQPEIARGALPATCEVPDDIVTMRHTDPELARRWRRALRETLGVHLGSGGRVRGVTRSGVYVLDRGAG